MSATIVGGSFNNPERLVQKLEKAFETWARFDVNDYFRDQFLEDKWSYPGETQRKSGELAGTSRNIFDLGELYRSGRDSFDTEKTINGINASWNWDAKNSSGRGYAWYVHEGPRLFDGNTNLAPRQWTDVFQQRDLFASSNVSKELKSRIRAAFRK
jgi:hypothetical protein